MASRPEAARGGGRSCCRWRALPAWATSLLPGGPPSLRLRSSLQSAVVPTINRPYPASPPRPGRPPRPRTTA
eukprot:scaffold15633_cov107-Isochrysis_galbana.AAC.10